MFYTKPFFLKRNHFILPVIFIVVSVNAQPVSAEFDELQSFTSDTLTQTQESILIGLLDNSLQSLAEQDRRGRKTGGYVMLGLGIGTAAGGAATLVFGEGDDARIVGYSLLGGGALLSGLSLIPFKVRSETERIFEEFEKMPASSPGEVHRKYVYFDRRFEELATKKRKERIIGGITTIVAAGITSLFLVDGRDWERSQTFIWPAVGGITALIIETDEERRYETYLRAKEDALGYTGRTQAYIGLSCIQAGGVGGAVQFTF